MFKDVENYYKEKFKKYGPTSKGVDWNSQNSHTKRFEIVLNSGIKDGDSVLDVGAGYGAFFDFIKKQKKNIYYCGIEFVEEMYEILKSKAPCAILNDFLKHNFNRRFDWSIAIGTFHVKTELIDSEKWWKDFVKPAILKMWKLSIKGIIFSLLPFNVERKYERLFYPDPSKLFETLDNISENYVIRRDYGLYEMTFIVKK